MEVLSFVPFNKRILILATVNGLGRVLDRVVGWCSLSSL